jgi:hypothetical protein
MSRARLEFQTLHLATEGQIFDEGKVLLTKTVKKSFPPPGTAAAATDVLLRLAGWYSTNG